VAIPFDVDFYLFSYEEMLVEQNEALEKHYRDEIAGLRSRAR